jgi:hypothetical protein
MEEIIKPRTKHIQHAMGICDYCIYYIGPGNICTHFDRQPKGCSDTIGNERAFQNVSLLLLDIILLWKY